MLWLFQIWRLLIHRFESCIMLEVIILWSLLVQLFFIFQMFFTLILHLCWFLFWRSSWNFCYCWNARLWYISWNIFQLLTYELRRFWRPCRLSISFSLFPSKWWSLFQWRRLAKYFTLSMSRCLSNSKFINFKILNIIA